MASPGGGKRSPTIAFVYPNSRQALAAEVAAGRAPDSTLLGQNHLAELGFDARIHDPVLRPAGGRLLRHLLWNLREVTLPWELRAADVLFTPLATLVPLAARARRRPRVVVVNYGLCTIWQRSTAARRRLLAASLRSAAAVVCLGASQRATLLEQTGLPPDQVATVRLGIDERYFAPRAAPVRDTPLVLAVGKDLARDYATFAEAVRGLSVRTVIAAYPQSVEGVKLPPGARVQFVGPADLRRLYVDAACVVVPQRRPEYPYGSEAGGLTALLEAMAMARPVVATSRPILHDYIEDGETALLVPPENPEALRAAIARTLEDADLASSLGAAARRRVEDGLTTRQFAAAIAPILLKAAA